MLKQSHGPTLDAASTYNLAADHYEEKPLGFWNRNGRRAAQAAALSPGDRVLDVGSGAGASAIPAAELVGPSGHVLGVDVSEKLLSLAQRKASMRALQNVTFRVQDMAALQEPDASFDAVISVFSIFFVTDMERQVGALWRMLRPGGRLVVTVWGERSFEPGATLFAEEVRRVRPGITQPSRPWQRLTRPEGLRALFLDGGATDPEISKSEEAQPLEHSSDFWTIALGSGFRAQIEQLTPREQRIVKSRLASRLVESGVPEIETNALTAIARR